MTLHRTHEALVALQKALSEPPLDRVTLLELTQSALDSLAAAIGDDKRPAPWPGLGGDDDDGGGRSPRIGPQTRKVIAGISAIRTGTKPTKERA